MATMFNVSQGKSIRVSGTLVRVAHIDGDKYTFPGNLPSLLKELSACDERIDVFTFIQPVPETEPKYSYPFEWDNLAVLPVTTFEEWWKTQIRGKTRNQARLGEKKGLIVKEVPFDDALLKGIVNIHNETPIRQGRRFPHFGMTLEGARKYAGTFLERSIYIGALFEGEIIGFAKLTVDETHTYACTINILSMLRHRDKAPTNAIIAQAVRSCVERQLSYLVYENFTYGNKPPDSLSHFKEVNGFRKMDLPRYYVPLSRVGRFAIRHGLHRRLVDYVPEAAMAKFRQLRSNWYERKLRTVESSGLVVPERQCQD
jgi:hypothetical protein